jgi:hypothetical protein
LAEKDLPRTTVQAYFAGSMSVKVKRPLQQVRGYVITVWLILQRVKDYIVTRVQAAVNDRQHKSLDRQLEVHEAAGQKEVLLLQEPQWRL